MGCLKITYRNEFEYLKVSFRKELSLKNSIEKGYGALELKNHLGSVLVTISDRKILEDINGNNIIDAEDHYISDVISYADYYAFGMVMPGRNGNISEMSYGYQGSEKDNEIKGNNNSYTTHFRQLDPRLGRWLSIDPKASSMPWQSPYCSMDNNPILYNDVFGDSIRLGKRLRGSEIVAIGEMLASSKGYRQLKKFAKAGQTIEANGKTYKFEKNGKFHKKGINLHFVDDYEFNTNGLVATPVASGATGVIGKDIYVMNRATGSQSEILSTSIHETFIHATMFGQDLYDDGKKNYSNISAQTKIFLNQYYKGDKESVNAHSHHNEMANRRVKYGVYKNTDLTLKPEGNYYYIGLSIMKSYNKSKGIKNSDSKIINELKLGVER